MKGTYLSSFSILYIWCAKEVICRLFRDWQMSILLRNLTRRITVGSTWSTQTTLHRLGESNGQLEKEVEVNTEI